MTIVLKNANILTMKEENLLENCDLLIKDNKIVGLGIGLTGETVIDCTGKYIMPGLTDMHNHTDGKNSDSVRLNVPFGITQIRVPSGNEEVLELRENAKESNTLLPLMYVASPILDGDPPVFEFNKIVSDVEEARKAVLDIKAKGYDFIKVYNNLKLSVYTEIIKTAREVSLDVIGHIPKDVGEDQAIKLGQYGFEHAKAISRKAILPTANAGIYWCTTYIVQKAIEVYQSIEGVTEGYYINGPAEYISADDKVEWRKYVDIFRTYDFKLDRSFEDYISDAKTFTDYGGLILSGTDAPMPLVVSGFALLDELELIARSGMSNFEVLKTTTVNCAKANHQMDILGTIEIGKIANIIILEKNPLESISHLRSLDGVILKGNYLSRAKLDTILEEIKCNASKKILAQ